LNDTIDANVLIYASNEADPAHSRATAILAELAASPDLVYIFWTTVMAYLRIVTHPSILPRPLSIAEASQNVSELLSPPHANGQ
jgi:predicted nucleic acid-binding protein